MHKYMIVGSILLTWAPANTNAQQLDLSLVSGQALYTAAALILVVLKPVLKFNSSTTDACGTTGIDLHTGLCAERLHQCLEKAEARVTCEWGWGVVALVSSKYCACSQPRAEPQSTRRVGSARLLCSKY